MDATKPVWTSKTFWAGIVGAVVSILALFGVVDAGTDTTAIVESITAVSGIAAVVFRYSATKKLKV